MIGCKTVVAPKIPKNYYDPQFFIDFQNHIEENRIGSPFYRR